jgi:allantoin racemase
VRLRVVTPIITRGLRDLADLRALECPGLRIEHRLIDEGPASIEGASDEALAAPAVIAAAVQAEHEGCDAVLIDCFGDPGLNGAREQVRIPVLGPGETSLRVATMLGDRFAIISVMDRVRPLLMNLLRQYGLADRLAAMRMVDMPVLDLHTSLSTLQQAMAAAAVAAVRDDGADVIVLGCTGFHGCAACVSEALAAAGLEVPVVDPIPITVQMARSLVASGLRHSKRQWPTPARKPIAGFERLQHALG